jgi:hypothetical protein
MREWEFLVHGAYVDDFPGTICLPEMTHYGLRYKEHPFEVDIENGVEIRFRHVPEIRPLLQTRIIDQDIDLAETPDSLLDELLAIGNLADIRLKGYGAALCRSRDSLHHFIRALLILPIADRHIRALACEALRDGPANPLIAAGYDSYLPLQPI